MSDELVKVSMNIILYAGNAKNECAKALEKMENNDFDQIDEQLKIAEDENLKAHKIHTEYLQQSIQKETNEFALLLTHAQDTLMTTDTEIKLIKHLVKCFRQIDERMKVLEQQ